MSSEPTTRTVPDAGAVLWRDRHGELEVALVHRPRYDDWSWPKGKLESGELWAAAAVREVQEETGLTARLGIPLPDAVYPLASDRTKHVHYWAAEATGGHGRLEHEIDQVRWVDVPTARHLLSYERDTAQLQAVETAARKNVLRTWPLIVVRHAEAIGRGSWRKDDSDRPLNRSGSRRSVALVPLLSAYGVAKVVTSDAVRCVDTVRPYAKAARLDLRRKQGLSEDGFESNPKKVLQHLGHAMAKAKPVALCTHRPLLPSMLAQLYDQALPGSRAEEMLVELSRSGIDKGEALVCHMMGQDDEARVVAVERQRPADR